MVFVIVCSCSEGVLENKFSVDKVGLIKRAASKYNTFGNERIPAEPGTTEKADSQP